MDITYTIFNNFIIFKYNEINNTIDYITLSNEDTLFIDSYPSSYLVGFAFYRNRYYNKNIAYEQLFLIIYKLK